MSILVTGGTGFAGASLVLDWLATNDKAAANLGKLACASGTECLRGLEDYKRQVPIKGNVNVEVFA